MKKLAADFTIRDDFPPVSYEQWRSMAEASLRGAPFEKKLVTPTYDGIDIQPVYNPQDALGEADPLGFPGLAPFVRGSHFPGTVEAGWDLRQEHAHPDLTVTHREILADLDGGVTSLHLRLDAAARQGLDPDQDDAQELAGHDGVMAYSVDDFDTALADVPLERVGVALDAGAAFQPAAALLAALWRRRGTAAEKARGAFNADPLAVLARTGSLPGPTAASLAAMAELAEWTAKNSPGVTAVGVDAAPYHNAGGTTAQDIAFAVATGVEYLRAMTNAGLDIDSAARQILFRFELGTNHFLAIAKLRAARRLWSRVVEASGGAAESAAMRIHARTGNRMLTRRDPHSNLLRNTIAVFAAGVGGADAITSVPFDAATGLPDDFSRRVARNTVLVLQEEAHLNRVADPAGGSWFLDQLTEQLADKSWEIFQATERHDGMLAVLASGWVAEQVQAAYDRRAEDFARRKKGITGVSEFVDVNERRVSPPAPDFAALCAAASARIEACRHSAAAVAAGETAATETLIDAATAGATLGQLSLASGLRAGPTPSIPRLQPRGFAEPFEELHDASDAWQTAHGRRPRVFLANIGPVVDHTARATFSKNFFEAGGFEVIGNDGFEDAETAAEGFRESDATIAVICSSDALYATFATPVATKLKEAGARCVVLAGFPGDEADRWRASGIDRFIHLKCNARETLRELLEEEGVMEPHEE